MEYFFIILMAIAIAAIIVSGIALCVACSALSTARGIEKTRFHYLQDPSQMESVHDKVFSDNGCST